MNARDMLNHLECILAESQAMLAAATQGQWDELAELEARQRVLINALDQAHIAFSDDAFKERKQILIRQIGGAHEQITILTQSWMGEIQGVLTSVRAERKLLKAYYAPG